MSNQSNSWWAQAVQNRLIALVLAMVVVVALVAAPASSALRGAGALAFEGLALVLFVTLVWRSRWNLSRQKVVEFLRTGPNTPILLFLGVVVLSCVLSPNKAFSMQETLRIASGVLLYFVVAHHFRRSEHLSKLLDTVLFVGIAASLLGFVELSMGNMQRAAGGFGNPQLLGSFLMILLPVVTVVAITEKKPGRQLAAQVAAVLMAAGLLLSQTRSAWIGTAVGLVVLSALALSAALRGRKNGIAVRKHELVLPAMLIVAVGLFLLLWPQTNAFMDRATTFSNVAGQGSWQARQQIWQDAMQAAKAHPLTGVGVGLFPVSNLGNSALRPTLSNDPHSLWLRTLAELGVPGLLLMVAVPLVFLFAGIRRVGQMDPGLRRNLLIGAIAAVAAFCVDAISNPAWGFAQTSMFFWLVLGLGVGAMRPVVRHREEVAVPAIAPRVLRPAGALAALALAALVLPTALFAVTDPTYLTGIDLILDSGTVRGGGVIRMEVIANYSGGYPSESVESLSTFTVNEVTYVSGPRGTLSGEGTENVAYNSKWRENRTITITATYAGKSDTETLVISYP